jgi:hypothetical protein
MPSLNNSTASTPPAPRTDTRSPTHIAVAVGGPPHGVDAVSIMLKPRCPGEG